jgi:predicted membrane protein
MGKSSGSDKRILFGVFLILVGVLWIFVKLDIIPHIWTDILVSWQMLLIGIGIFSIIGGNNTAGTILIVVGGFFLIPEIFSVPFHLRRMAWPVLIIGIGLAMILTHRKKSSMVLPEPGESGTDSFDDFVIFGGSEKFINSKNFSGGKVTAMFGGAEYDLREVNLAEKGAVIDCVTVFGGCGFKVPPDWKIVNEVNTVFGGFSDKRTLSIANVVTDPSKLLVIRGFTAFGGIEIKYK